MNVTALMRCATPMLLLGAASPAMAADNGLACRPGGSADPKATGFWERPNLTGNWGGLRDDLEKTGITFGLQEQSAVFANVSGGRRRGGAYDGQTSMNLTVDLQQALGWNGATFYASAYQLHGRGPTPTLVNSLQPPSNLEATFATRLYSLWLEQTLPGNQVCIRIGKGAASDEFMLSRNAAALMNSAFGFPTLAALDLPSAGPNYPLSSPFVRVKYQPSDTVTLMIGVYNGDPVGPGTGDPQLRDPSGTNFRFHDDTFVIAEAAYALNPGKDARYPGIYRFGAWFHSGRFPDQAIDTLGLSLADTASSGLPRQNRNNYALFALFDQMVWHPGTDNDRGIGLFGLITGAPLGDRNLIDLFVAAGLNWKGPLPREDRKDDVLAFGIAYAHLGADARQFGNQLVAFTGSGHRSATTRPCWNSATPSRPPAG